MGMEAMKVMGVFLPTVWDWVFNWSTFPNTAFGSPLDSHHFPTNFLPHQPTPQVCFILIISLHLSLGISQTHPNSNPSLQMRPTLPFFFPNGVKFYFPGSVSGHRPPPSASVASPGTSGQAYLKDLEQSPGVMSTELR